MLPKEELSRVLELPIKMFQWACEDPENVAELSRFAKELVKALQG